MTKKLKKKYLETTLELDQKDKELFESLSRLVKVTGNSLSALKNSVYEDDFQVFNAASSELKKGMLADLTSVYIMCGSMRKALIDLLPSGTFEKYERTFYEKLHK